MRVFVLDKNKKPLDSTHPARARELLTKGRAAVFRRYPMTIILKDRTIEESVTHEHRLKIDPGALTTGLAVLRGNSVVFAAVLTHRGFAIGDALTARRAIRRSRRNRKTRDRAPRFDNRRRPDGWLPPSLLSRVENICTWVSRLRRLLPLFHRMQSTGLPVETGSGGLTKFNRTRLGLEKTHYWDAASVGESTPDVLKKEVSRVLAIKATGYGHRRMVNLNRYGFPLVNKKGQVVKRSGLKVMLGFQTGDMARATVPNGKHKGTHVGRVTVRATGAFELHTGAASLPSIRWKHFSPIHRADGYSYSFKNAKS